MKADSNNKRLFYTLIQRQCTSKQATCTLTLDIVTDHFERWAQPQMEPDYDQDWMECVWEDVQYLDSIEKSLPPNTNY